MAGGQKINDHSFWAGGRSKESVFPMNAKMKQYTSAEGGGKEPDYEDTSAKIKEAQEKNASKAKSHQLKADYRN